MSCVVLKVSTAKCVGRYDMGQVRHDDYRALIIEKYVCTLDDGFMIVSYKNS